MNEKAAYIPALKFHWLTRFYDKLLNTFLREKRWKERLISAIDNPGPKNIMDVGCGTATLTMMLKREFPDTQLTGIDGDESILAIASEKVEAAGLHIELKQALSYDLPFPDNSFDVVVSSLMLHHLTDEDKHNTIMEVLHVLRPGSQFTIADWGKPNTFLVRFSFYLVQLLDGFKTTNSNVKGKIPLFLTNCGMVSVRELERIPTVLGSISIYSAMKK